MCSAESHGRVSGGEGHTLLLWLQQGAWTGPPSPPPPRPSGQIGYIAVLSPREEKAAVDQEKCMALGSGRGAWTVLLGPTPSPSLCSPPPL